MQEIILQVGALLLGSVPTLLLFIALVVAYQLLVHAPLSRTLAARRARTLGAVEDAQRAIAEAEARAAEYAEQLRLARAEIFRAREQKLQQWAADREAALAQAREQSARRVAQSRESLAAEVAVARQTLLASADELAMQVVRALLPDSRGPVAAGGAR